MQQHSQPFAQGTTYNHTQHGKLHWIIGLVAFECLVAAAVLGQAPLVANLLLCLSVVLFYLAFSFRDLTVLDDGQCLAICFGPLPFFQKRFAYDSIDSAEADRTRFIDGWGIHWIPGRGWTYNVWGYDCVKLCLGRKVARIGTDDAPRLVEFLQTRVGPSK